MKQLRCVYNQPEQEEYDLNPTDDGEPSEESHGASYETQLALKFDLSVSLDLVVGCRVEENMDKLKG